MSFTNVATYLELASTPSTPGAGKWKIYPKTDNIWYFLDDAGVERPIAYGGASSLASLTLTGTAGAGFVSLPEQASAPSTPTNAVRLYADASNRLGWVGESGFGGLLDASGLSANRIYTLPNFAGSLLVGSVTSTATAAGTTTLTAASTRTQIFTGTLTQTVKLAAANTLVLGWEYLIRNTSTGAVTVQDNAAGALVVLGANQEVTVICTNIGSAAGTWSLQAVTGSGARVNATSPTIVTPTIVDFTNAQHDHLDADDGGTLNATAIAAGTVAIARLPASLVRGLFTQTAGVTVANTTTTTSLVSTGVGSVTLAANSLIAGSWIRLTAMGYYSTKPTPAGTAQLGLNVAGVNQALSGTIALSPDLVNLLWMAEILLVVRTAGGTGTAIVNGHHGTSTTASAIQERALKNTATFVIDTTTTNVLDLTWAWATADAANTTTITQLVIEQGAA